MTNFAFAMPVPAKKTDEQWHHLNEMLGKTVSSILNQSRNDFRVYVAGHDFPEILSSFNDSRIEFISVDYKRISDPAQGRKDKNRKRWAIAARFREAGGGYFMYMDSDDYVHRDLVQYVHEDNNRVGYFIREGYALDYKGKRVAPIPGAWKKNFNEVCGSSGMIYFGPEDLPRSPYSRFSLRTEAYFKVRNHKVFETIEWRGGRTAPVPFPAGIYNVNNELNLSNILVRTEERQRELANAIAKLEITDPGDILQEFGIEL